MDYIQKTIELHNHFGNDENYVQAAGGNISIKDGDIIHIKKSGLSFKDIKDKNDIISLNISKEEMIQEVLSITNKKNLENRYNEFINQKNTNEERPSIELSFHIFGDKYTLHLHPTLINIFTCTEEGQEIIKKICKKNDNISYVDYYKPGIILTDKIMEERSTLNDITFLFNHGIIITGPSEDSIKDRYRFVEEMLKKEIVYEEYKQDNELLSKSLNPEYFLIINNFLEQKGFEIFKSELDDINRENAVNVHELPHLYPDSAIYNAQVAFPTRDLHTSPISKIMSGDLIVYGEINHDEYQWGINVSSEKEAIFKTELFINKMKIEYFAKLNGFTPSYLDKQSVDELVNWDAEKYRQELLK